MKWRFVRVFAGLVGKVGSVNFALGATEIWQTLLLEYSYRIFLQRANDLINDEYMKSFVTSEQKFQRSDNSLIESSFWIQFSRAEKREISKANV